MSSTTTNPAFRSAPELADDIRSKKIGSEELLDLFRRNPKWDDEAARKQLLKIFEALGATDPSVVSGRRKLSSILFS